MNATGGGSGGEVVGGAGGAMNDGGSAGRDGGAGSGARAGNGGSAGGGGVAGGGSGGDGGSPADVPVQDGLTLWLDAFRVGQPGPAISVWENLALGESDAMQNAPIRQPSLTTVDGLPGVLFGGEQWMNFQTGFDDYSNGLTIFAVARFDAPDRCEQLFQVSTGPELHDISLQSDQDPGGSRRVNFEVENTHLWTIPDALTPGHVALIGLFVKPNGDGEIFVNGQQMDVAVGDLELVPDVELRTANFLGSGSYETCATFQGVVFEFLLYERPLARFTEFTQVTSYLSTKWQ